MRLIVALVLATALACPADDWPHFRGPARDGISAESSRHDEGAWPPGDPAWTAHVGEGGSSPIIAGGHVYTLGWRDGQDALECRDLATGELLWAQSTPAPQYGRFHAGDERLYSGPSATPELDAATGLLYTLGIDGDLACRDTTREGELVWSLNLYETFGAGQRPDVGGGVRDYGYTCAPMALDGALLVEAGSPQGTLIALDPRTGERLWASECTDPAGHTASMAPLTVDGIPCVAVMTLRGLLVARVDAGHEGQTLVQFPWETHYANSIASPAVLDDSIVLTSGYSQSRTVRVRITSAGAELVWEAKNRYSKVCTPIIHEGSIYFAWQKLRCLDWETGEQRWEGGRCGDDASLILTADERLIVLGAKTLALCETAARAPEAYTELSLRGSVGSDYCWPHVALSDGRLLCRDRDGNLLCFDLNA